MHEIADKFLILFSMREIEDGLKKAKMMDGIGECISKLTKSALKCQIQHSKKYFSHL
jgi:hypothetical protein